MVPIRRPAKEMKHVHYESLIKKMEIIDKINICRYKLSELHQLKKT